MTDSEGKTFTLSEALKDHEAVLINFWATWCDPCKNEFPMLNKVYEEVKDKVAFIALSKEPKDTAEKIEAFRQERKAGTQEKEAREYRDANDIREG